MSPSISLRGGSKEEETGVRGVSEGCPGGQNPPAPHFVGTPDFFFHELLFHLHCTSMFFHMVYIIIS